MAKKKDDQIRVKKFKNSDTDFWVNKKHYTFKNNNIEIVAGGEESIEEVLILKDYINGAK